MTDFVSYLLFMFIGVVFASFFGWLFMGWYCSRQPGEAERGWLGTVLAALLAIFGASR